MECITSPVDGSCLSICPLVTAQPSGHCEDDSYHQYQYGKEAFRKSHLVYPEYPPIIMTTLP